jgi:hypothetical protein
MTKATPFLESKTKTYIEIRVGALSRFITEVYGESMDIPKIESWIIYCSYTMDIEKGHLHPFEQDEIEGYLAGKPSCGITEILLRDMVNRGLLPAGSYLIDVY